MECGVTWTTEVSHVMQNRGGQKEGFKGTKQFFTILQRFSDQKADRDGPSDFSHVVLKVEDPTELELYRMLITANTTTH